MATAETKVRITGDPKGALSAIDRVKGGLSSLSATAARLPGFTALGAAVAGAFSAAAIRGIANTADELAKLSRRTGITIEDLSAYDYAVTLSGASTQEFASAIDRLNRNIADAAKGLSTPADAFAKIGVAVTDADGNLRGTRAALEDVMQAFSELPEGPERAAIAMELFGRSGAKLATFLDLGTAGMQLMREEAERLGIVFDERLGAAAEQFNDNMTRLGKSLEGLKVTIGNAVIPALAAMSDEFLDAQRAGLTFFEFLEARASNGIGKLGKDAADVATEIDKLKAELTELEALRATAPSADSALVKSGLVRNNEQEIASIKRLLDYYERRRKALADLSADPKSAQAKAARELADLEKRLGEERLRYARAVATETKKSSDEQIRDAQRLEKALQKAWQESVSGAKAAGEEAAKLLKQAAASQQDFHRQAAQRRAQDLPEEQQQSQLVRQARQATDDAAFLAAAAEVAAIDKRAQAAADYAERAKKIIEEAADAANQVQDNDLAADLLERLGEASAAALRAEAKLKQTEQQQLGAQAADQAKQIEALQAKLDTLKQDAAGVPVQFDTDAAKKRIAELQEAIKKLKAEAAQVKVGAGTAPAGNTGGATGSFASGGYTGSGGKYRPAGIVHRGEYVLPHEIVRQPGALAFLRAFHGQGMSLLRHLRGYADGGLVGNIRLPQVRAAAPAARTPVVIDLGALGRVGGLTTSAGVVEDVERLLRRAALKGGRR